MPLTLRYGAGDVRVEEVPDPKLEQPALSDDGTGTANGFHFVRGRVRLDTCYR
jgi:hypothetical protein